MTDLFNLVFVVQSNFFRRFLTMDYKFSIGFKLGEFSGHSKTFIFIFLNNLLLFLPCDTELNLAKNGIRMEVFPFSRDLLLITGRYTLAFSMPSTNTGAPGPLIKKHPETSFCLGPLRFE